MLFEYVCIYLLKDKVRKKKFYLKKKKKIRNKKNLIYIKLYKVE